MRSSRVLLSIVFVAFGLLLGALTPSCASTSADDNDLGVVIDFEVPGDQAMIVLPPGDGMSGVDLARTTCDLGSAPDAGDHARLLVTATTTGGAPYVAIRTSAGWGPVVISGGAGSNYAALVGTSIAGLPLLVGRQSDDTLGASLYDPCAAIFPALLQPFSLALTAERPAAVGGSVVDVIFRGSLSGDQRLFATHFDGTWHAAQTLGNFLSILPPVALREGQGVHAIFTGTDTNLYDGLVDGMGGAATQLTGASSDRGPAADTASDGTTYVAWKGIDTNLYWTARPPSGAYASPLALCTGQTSCLIASNEAPVLSFDDVGAPAVAWIGKADGIVYVAKLDTGSGVWSAPIAAGAETTTLQPGLTVGVDSAELELVYVRATDGKGRHVRLVGGTFQAPVDLPDGPLGSRPSLSRTGVD